ncbi:cysteine desulfurase [Alphaproteobacteria bacterium]|nr:cysteine desulfurase [Alphaproteobacteria bacterium]
MKKVYLDYAASAPVRNEVIWEMQRAFYDYGNPSSLHASGRKAKARIDKARAEVAGLIGADSTEITFTSGGTEANNMVLNTMWGLIYRKSQRNEIIVSAIEHPSILEMAKFLENLGFTIHYLPVDKSGRVKYAELEKLLNSKTFLVSVMLANNEIGTLQDVVKITTLAHKNGALVHTDVSQALGKIPIDVEKLGVDYMTMSAHKIGGPKGVGALYVRSGAPLTSLILGGHQEDKLRAGTENMVSIVGFGVAATLASRYMPKYNKEIRQYRDKLRDFIVNNIDNVAVNTPANALPNILNVSFAAAEGESILLALDSKGIEVSTGSACASGNIRSSHVLMAIGADPELAHGSIRFSLGPDTTEAEIDYVIAKLPPIIEKLRKMSTVQPARHSGHVPESNELHGSRNKSGMTAQKATKHE